MYKIYDTRKATNWGSPVEFETPDFSEAEEFMEEYILREAKELVEEGEFSVLAEAEAFVHEHTLIVKE